ncbi:MAG: hypothetical protein J4F28_08560 [Nitrosopumilaceae archaeon]|nr:hypothetical protein [Nitrosopumilaceae archaeon]
MNQLIQYMMIFGVVGIFFGVLYVAGLGELAGRSDSQLEQLERYEKQVLEYITLVEVVSESSPATVDVINTGSKPIRIESLLANGVDVPPGSYTTGAYDAATGTVADTGGVLPEDVMTRIDVPAGSMPLLVVTDNERMFVLGGD